MKFWLLLFVCVLLTLAASINAANDDPQYHSVTPPFGLQHWSLGKDAFMTEDYIRLAEDRQSRKGWFWNTIPCDYQDWEVIFQLRVHGVSKVGADGMAFWYTQDTKIVGDVFGNQEKFKGLGVVIDTYDNDNSGKHPYIALLSNDGTHAFDHVHDDSGGSGEIGGCQAQIRNLANPSSIKVTYNRGVLDLAYDLQNTGNWVPCTSARVNLPRGYYFGFTAATGHLADNHDLYSFDVQNLDPYYRPTPTTPTSTSMNEAEFTKVLSSLRKELRNIGRLPAQSDSTPSGKQSSPATESKLDAISSLITKLSNDVKQITSRPGASGQSGCSGLGNQVTNVQKTLDKMEKENNKKHADLRDKIGIISRGMAKASGFDIFGLLNLVVLVALLVFTIIAYLVYDSEKRQKYSSFR